MLILQVKQSYVDSRPTLRQGLARAWFQQRLSRHVGPGSVRPVCGPSAERGAKRWEPDEQTPGSRDMHSGSTAKCLISKADAISTPTPTAVQNGTPLELRRHRHSRRSSYAAPTGLSGRRAIGRPPVAMSCRDVPDGEFDPIGSAPVHDRSDGALCRSRPHLGVSKGQERKQPENRVKQRRVANPWRGTQVSVCSSRAKADR